MLYFIHFSNELRGNLNFQYNFYLKLILLLYYSFPHASYFTYYYFIFFHSQVILFPLIYFILTPLGHHTNALALLISISLKKFILKRTNIQIAITLRDYYLSLNNNKQILLTIINMRIV